MIILEFLLANGADICDEEAFRAAANYRGREDKLRFLVEMSRSEDPMKRERLLQVALVSLMGRQAQADTVAFIVSDGLSLPDNHKLSFELIDAATRGRAEALDRLVQLVASDDHGFALQQSAHHAECVRILLSRYSYTREQILDIILRLRSPLAVFYYNLMTNTGITKAYGPLFLADSEPSSQEREESLKHLISSLYPSRSPTSQLSHGAIRVLLHPRVRTDLALSLVSTCRESLTLACFCGCSDAVLQLLDGGIVDINARDKRGMTLLMAAVLSGSESLVAELLERGAWPGDVCWYQLSQDETTVEGDSLTSPSVVDASAGPHSTFESLGATHADVVDMVNRDWELIWDFLGRETFLESPISLRARHTSDSYNLRSSRAEAKKDRIQIFNNSLKQQSQSADSHAYGFLRFKSISWGSSISDLESSFKRMGWRLIEHFNKAWLTAEVPDGYSFFGEVPARVILSNSAPLALHTAMEQNWYLLAQKLMEIGMLPTTTNTEGKTPLHLFRSGTHPLIIQQMLESGADLSAADNGGRTPLHDAIIRNCKVAREFIRLGAPLEARTNKGRTPLHDAVGSGRQHVEELLQFGAAPDACDNEGLTPMHTAIRETASRGTEYRGLEVVTVLVQCLIKRVWILERETSRV